MYGTGHGVDDCVDGFVRENRVHERQPLYLHLPRGSLLIGIRDLHEAFFALTDNTLSVMRAEDDALLGTRHNGKHIVILVVESYHCVFHTMRLNEAAKREVF